MKNHFEHFQAFIEEQKKWFEQHLSADFAQTWNDHIWVSGNQGSGWLRGNGRNTLRFDEMNRFKGIVEHLPIDKEYSQFMKAMLVVVYRQGNRSMSPAVAKATLMILKRWYHAMLYETGLKWSTKTGHRVRVFSSIDFPIRLGVTHRYIRAVLVRCNIQRYNPLWRELPR